MLKYLGSCLAAFNVASKHPEVHAEARLKFGKGTVMALSSAGMVAAASIASLGLGTDWRPYALLCAWLAVGLTYYAFTWRRASPTG